MQCKYCYNREYRNSQKDLNLSQWKTIIDKITPYCIKITFTGGEVFLHKSFSKIIEYVKQKDENIKISVISNGTIDYEKLNIKKTFEAINTLDLSCDNITDDNHLRFGFNKKVFVKNIEYLKKIV